MKFVNDEIHEIPHPLTVYPLTGNWTNPDFQHDISIAGIKWLSAASEEYPYQRQLTKVTKQQLDVGAAPGDNTLEGWWTQSQTDWSGGGDQIYFEPAVDEMVKRRFYTSASVDVFNRPGFFSLLPDSSLIDTGAADDRLLIQRIADRGYVYSLGSVFTVMVDGAETTVTAPGVIVNLYVAASFIIVACDDDTSYMYSVSAPSVQVATITGYTGTPVFSYVKNRLMVSVANEMYELADFELGGDLSAEEPVIKMPSSTAVVGNAVATPSVILTYANDGNNATMLGLALDDDGALPELSVPVELGVLPSSETIRGLASTLGSYVLVLTSAGCRVATASQNGGLVYGPLIGSPEPAGYDDLPVEASEFNRFLSYPVNDAGDGFPGEIVIDLSVSDEEGRYAWSTFNRAAVNVDACLDSARLGERESLIACRDLDGTYLYHVSDEYGLADRGWLHTSWIRFGTLENKYFDQIRVVCDPVMAGRVTVSAVTDTEQRGVVGTLTPDIGQEAVFKINAREGMTDMAIRFDLQPDELDSSRGPVVAAWSLRAWPAVQHRGEQVVLPLLCFDHEVDSLGVNVGGDFYARDRWEALTEALTAGAAVLVEEVNSGFSYEAVAEDATFTQTAPGNNASGFGGIVQVVLRKT